MNFEEIVDEIKSIIVEGEFTARWTLIETYHKVGELLSQLKGEKTKQLQQVAQEVNKSERTLWYALAFYNMFPTLDLLPEGKNTSWGRVVRKYLLPAKKDSEHECDWIEVCRICGKKRV